MENSNKGIVIFLIIVIALSLNYMVYQYILQPKYNDLKVCKEEYIEREDELEELIKTKNNIKNVKNENEALKKSIEELDKLIAKEIDTPQLVYDFYKSCKDYGINGEEVEFSLSQEGFLEDEKDTREVKENEVKENEVKEKKLKEKEGELEEDIIRLEILLKVNGEKNNIEKYIKSLDKITKRKLNVKSIKLFSMDEENNLSPESIGIIRSNYIEVEISFYHYVELSNEEIEKIKKYDFYHNKIGFDSIPEMFR
ncbi:hypothetical protein [uncultured Clostridium sp.]|uniref:hypothetical protein n=1 Tax=uncultured Clostridium sp. TaxID=59620 RepID=UPI0028EEB00B|nr:hypothetical protein [uncultured Clostridium sp.]